MISREQFIEDAWRLEGTAFLHQGTDPAIGIDCVNAPAYLVRQQGVELPFTMPLTYRSDVHNFNLIEETLRTHLTEIPESEAQSGDLYLFVPPKVMRHLAIRLTDDTPPLLLHPSSEPRPNFPNGKVTVEPFTDRWPKIFKACFRIPFEEW